MKLNKILVGVAGEYYVAAELSKRGYLASITLRNSEGIDILCSNQSGSKAVTIQVKTSYGSKQKWILSSKAEDSSNENLFYIFVVLGNLDSIPEYYIVPSKVVADFVKITHSEWLKGKKSDGEARKDSAIRNFKDLESFYKDRWDFLGLD